MLKKVLELRHAQAYTAALQALLHATGLRNDASFSGRAGKIPIINLLSFPTIQLSFQTLTVWTEMQHSKSLPQADVFSFPLNNYYTAIKIAMPNFQKTFCAILVWSFVHIYYEDN